MASIDYPLDRRALRQAEFSFSETLYRWVATVDHKRLGFMYIVTALIFLVIAGLMASVIRCSSLPRTITWWGRIRLTGLFTMHGTTMVFLVGMPIVADFRTTWCR